MRFHFICRGNAFRSRMAEAYLVSLKLPNVEVVSSGTVADTYRSENDPISRHAKVVLSKLGLLEFAKTRCDQLTQSRILPGDITICMNQRIFNECKDVVVLPNDAIVWGIDDVDEHFTVHPEDEEIDRYAEQVFETIKKNVDILIQQHTS